MDYEKEWAKERKKFITTDDEINRRRADFEKTLKELNVRLDLQNSRLDQIYRNWCNKMFDVREGTEIIKITNGHRYKVTRVCLPWFSIYPRSLEEVGRPVLWAKQLDGHGKPRGTEWTLEPLEWVTRKILLEDPPECSRSGCRTVSGRLDNSYCQMCKTRFQAIREERTK